MWKEGLAVTEGLPTDPCSWAGRCMRLCRSMMDTAGGRRELRKFSWLLLSPDTEEGRHQPKEQIDASLLRQARCGVSVLVSDLTGVLLGGDTAEVRGKYRG